jgi:molybdate transport system substrate-binding protein
MPNKDSPNKNSTVRCVTRVFASLIALAVMLPVLSAASDDRKCRAQLTHDPDEIFPPWQKGENNDALNRGVDFTIPQIDSLADFHGRRSSRRRAS